MIPKLDIFICKLIQIEIRFTVHFDFNCAIFLSPAIGAVNREYTAVKKHYVECRLSQVFRTEYSCTELTVSEKSL